MPSCSGSTNIIASVTAEHHDDCCSVDDPVDVDVIGAINAVVVGE
jgi:hypothetical protein